jgi:hypothetical protein
MVACGIRALPCPIRTAWARSPADDDHWRTARPAAAAAAPGPAAGQAPRPGAGLHVVEAHVAGGEEDRAPVEDAAVVHAASAKRTLPGAALRGDDRRGRTAEGDASEGRRRPGLEAGEISRYLRAPVGVRGRSTTSGQHRRACPRRGARDRDVIEFCAGCVEGGAEVVDHLGELRARREPAPGTSARR